jgi:hypothetical protein
MFRCTPGIRTSPSIRCECAVRQAAVQYEWKLIQTHFIQSGVRIEIMLCEKGSTYASVHHSASEWLLEYTEEESFTNCTQPFTSNDSSNLNILKTYDRQD